MIKCFTELKLSAIISLLIYKVKFVNEKKI